MTWGGLNPALTAWRNGIVALFPRRGTQSDGARADAAHGSTSQHQADADGTVDAYDSDVNYLGSSVPAGTELERRLTNALNADFLDDDRAQLVISNRRIANVDVAGGAWRTYSWDSPHIEHTHYQARQSRERDGRAWRYPRTVALLREIGEIVDPKDIAKIADAVVAKLEAKYGAAWTSAASAWDDEAGRGENRRSTLEILQEARTAALSTIVAVTQLKDALPKPVEPAPVDPA